LLLHQVDPHRSKGRSILHRRTHILRKCGDADLLTARTALLFGLVFDHQHALGRQINHLSAFHGQALHFAQIPLAVLAVLNRVHDHTIGGLRQLQRASRMTRLSPSLLATLLAQTLGLPMKAIRGWRQVAVVAVFLELVLQRLHLLTEHSLLLLHLGDQLISLHQLLPHLSDQLVSLRQLFLPLTLFSS